MYLLRLSMLSNSAIAEFITSRYLGRYLNEVIKSLSKQLRKCERCNLSCACNKNTPKLALLQAGSRNEKSHLKLQFFY